jgi:hypothetical protein
LPDAQGSSVLAAGYGRASDDCLVAMRPPHNCLVAMRTAPYRGVLKQGVTARCDDSPF